MDQFDQIYYQCLEIYRNLYVDSIPSVIKYASSLLGLCKNEVRNPLIPVSPEVETRIKKILMQANLIT